MRAVLVQDQDGDLHLVAELGSATQVPDRLAAETLCGMPRESGTNEVNLGVVPREDARLCADCVRIADRENYDTVNALAAPSTRTARTASAQTSTTTTQTTTANRAPAPAAAPQTGGTTPTTSQTAAPTTSKATDEKDDTKDK